MAERVFFRILQWIGASLCLFSLALAGCGEVKTAADAGDKKSSQKSAKKPKQAPAPKLEVKPDAYPSVQKALEAITAATKENDQKILREADEWIKMQGDKGFEVLAETLQNEQATLPARMACCRALGRLGPKSKGPLLAVLKSPAEQLHGKALECLGMLKPTDQEIVDKMTGLLKSKDAKLRLAALRALALIGTPAKATEPQLLEILHSQTEDDTTRAAAKAALKSVAPRHTFVN